MSSLTDDLGSSKYAKLLKDECMGSIYKRRGKEILLLIYFLIVLAVISIYLWVNGFIYDFWFYIMIGIVLMIVLAGYLMDRQYRPNWKYYFLEILKEMKVVDTIKLSDFINAGQPFFGANLGNCEKFIKIAEGFIKNQIIDIVIRGPIIYLKGHEPPPEEDNKKESEDENA